MNVIVFGAKDRQLDELLLAAGLRAKHVNAADLERLGKPSAVQPDVLIID